MNFIPLLASGGAAHAGAHAAPVPSWVTVLFSVLLVVIIAALALEEKIHARKSVITSIGALIALFLGGAFHVLPFGGLVDAFGHRIELPVYIPAIDWGVIAIIFGASLFVDVTAKSGLFSWIAIRLTKASGGDPLKLLASYGLLTVVFSAVLNNVTAMLIVGSLTAVSLDKLGKKDKLLGFLLVEGLLTNVGGLLTLISSVPNIIVGQAAHIGFMHFFLVASPYVLVATVATILAGARVFHVSRFRSSKEKAQGKKLVAGFDENDGVHSKNFFWFSAFMFLAFIGVLATTSVIPVLRDLEMGYVALAFGFIMLIRYKSEANKFYEALDWDLILFFATLFVVINVMEHAQVLALIGGGLGKMIDLGPRAGSASLLVSAAAVSSVTDNIPLSAVLAKILQGMPSEQVSPGMWWSIVFGANLGGNLTPIGSASTVVAVTIMHKHGLGVTFMRFVKLAAPFAAVQILLAVLYVVVFL